MWRDEIRLLQNGIERRYIVTGNIINAFRSPLVASRRPQTIYFTMQLSNGESQWVPGLLMPENMQEEKSTDTTFLPFEWGLPLCKVSPSTVKGYGCKSTIYKISGSDVPVDFFFKIEGTRHVMVKYMTSSTDSTQNKLFEELSKSVFKDIYPLFKHMPKQYIFEYQPQVRWWSDMPDYVDPNEQKILDCLTNLGYSIEVPTKNIPQSIYDKIQADRYNYEWERLDWSPSDIPDGKPKNDDAKAKRKRKAMQLALAIEIELNMMRNAATDKGVNGIDTPKSRATQLRRFIAKNYDKRYINVRRGKDGFDITADDHKRKGSVRIFTLATADPDYIIRTLFN